MWQVLFLELHASYGIKKTFVRQCYAMDVYGCSSKALSVQSLVVRKNTEILHKLSHQYMHCYLLINLAL